VIEIDIDLGLLERKQEGAIHAKGLVPGQDIILTLGGDVFLIRRLGIVCIPHLIKEKTDERS